MQHWSATDLRDYLASGEQPLLLDVREPWEFAQCRIEGSVNMPMGQVVQHWHDLDPARETVVICHHGMRSMQIALLLQQAGFQRVTNLDGGIDAWSQNVDPSVPRY